MTKNQRVTLLTADGEEKVVTVEVASNETAKSSAEAVAALTGLDLIHFSGTDDPPTDYSVNEPALELPVNGELTIQ
jgi:hypothetical protein